MAPPRIRRAVALPAAGESLSGLSLTTHTGEGVPAVTVSAGTTTAGPVHQSGQVDRGRTGGRIFPLAGRRTATGRGEHTAVDEDSATGTSVAGVRAASQAATQGGRTESTTATPGSKAGRPLFVAAALAGAVLAAVPFVHGKGGGTVNYEGLGEARPLADLTPDADNSDAILHPDGQSHSMPLVDPSEGIAAEPLVPQAEVGPFLAGGPAGSLDGGAASDEERQQPGPVGPVAPERPVPHPSANTNKLLGVPSVASGLARATELKGSDKTEPHTFPGSSHARPTAPVGHPEKPVQATTVKDEAPDDTTSARRSLVTAAAVTPLANAVTGQDTSDATPPVSPPETTTVADVPVQSPSTAPAARTALTAAPVAIAVTGAETPVEHPAQSEPATTTTPVTDTLPPTDGTQPPVAEAVAPQPPETEPYTPAATTPETDVPPPAEQPKTEQPKTDTGTPVGTVDGTPQSTSTTTP